MQNPLSLTGLISWLEKQPADGDYDYYRTRKCLCFQYLTTIGLPVELVTTKKWFELGWKPHPLPEGFNDIAAAEPHTFGAALERARRFQAEGVD